MTYIPALGITAHYFHRRRPLAMGIVASGSSFGGFIHPIMLNKLFHGSTGFHTGVRASAALNLGVLVVANLLMRTRLPPRKTAPQVPIASFARDIPYVFTVLGCVRCSHCLLSFSYIYLRGFVSICGMFVPVFFLQLYAITHGINSNLSFYSVRYVYYFPTHVLIPSSDNDLERCKCRWSYCARFHCSVCWSFQSRRSLHCSMWNFNILPDCREGRRRDSQLCHFLWFLLRRKYVGALVSHYRHYIYIYCAAITLMPPMLASLAKDVNEIGARMGICFALAGT